MRRACIKIFLWLIFFASAAAGVIYLTGLFQFAQETRQSLKNIKGSFLSALTAIKRLEPGRAREELATAALTLDALKTEVDGLGLIRALVKNLPETFSNLAELTTRSLQITEDLDTLKNSGFQWFVAHRGDQLLALLRRLEKHIDRLPPLLEQIKEQAALVNYPLGDDVPATTKQFVQGRQLLKAVIGWLANPAPQHLLILFQNQTELRPGGGFLGSYADVTLHRGGLVNLDVKDVYDADGQLERKIVPPLPLQAITPDWKARDANWFFDFPTSARKVASLLEASKFYQERQMHFSAVVAVNTRLIQDLLVITGPIELPDYGTTIDSQNFLSTIQYEVETGTGSDMTGVESGLTIVESDSTEVRRPKRILQVLTPLLFERLGALTAEQKKSFLEKISQRFAARDIMVYAEDPLIESYLKRWGVGGEIAALPKDFNGDYLAVVAANIAGGKTDRFIHQTVNLASDLSLTGVLTNTLSVSRTLYRSDAPPAEWWYYKPNQSYLQILVPAQSLLLNLEGGEGKEISPPVDYQELHYEIDSDLEALQTGTAFNRQMFTTWLTVSPEETKTTVFTYRSGGLVNLKNPFVFVVEKQSGADNSFSYTIAAPVGYRWQESGAPVFRYTADNLSARLVIELHLIK